MIAGSRRKNPADCFAGFCLCRRQGPICFWCILRIDAVELHPVSFPEPELRRLLFGRNRQIIGILQRGNCFTGNVEQLRFFSFGSGNQR
ncbi:Uncharacterised protein [Serratia marcescens]|nr:Uncharacterised protein [Serratia marcescens]